MNALTTLMTMQEMQHVSALVCVSFHFRRGVRGNSSSPLVSYDNDALEEEEKGDDKR